MLVHFMYLFVIMPVYLVTWAVLTSAITTCNLRQNIFI